MSTTTVGPPGSYSFSSSLAWTSLHDSGLLGRQKQKQQDPLKAGLGSPRTLILPHSIGPSRSQFSFAHGEEIHPTACWEQWHPPTEDRIVRSHLWKPSTITPEGKKWICRSEKGSLSVRQVYKDAQTHFSSDKCKLNPLVIREMQVTQRLTDIPIGLAKTRKVDK